MNGIGALNIYRGQLFRYHIPWDTFYDNQDFFTPNLTLELRLHNFKFLEREYPWIKFDAKEQVIYAFPINKTTVAIHGFMMIARDKEGKMDVDPFQINVLNDSSVSYNHQFTLEVDNDYDEFSKDFDDQMELVTKLAEYFNVNSSSIRTASFTRGSVVMKFQFDSSVVPYDECDFPERVKFLSEDGDDVNSDLKKALEPKFRVKSGKFEGLGPCGDVVDVLPATSSGQWKTYVIIPVVILAVVLLVVGICLFLVLRSRKRRKLSLEDQQLFVYKRKPAVLQEEYEVKERLLKQPLVLPNEKPPLAAPVHPRSPSLKHQNGDPPQSPSYQAPSFTSFRQPSNQGTPNGNSPRKPGYSGYRLPPAYVPP